ncbi:hypothetical protein ACCC98_29895 [Rhizobium pisi]|uniref:hypothetical protein n=1 Tax=Rhizobium pisi TaxID=574561 RepID=UPI0039B0A952
MTISADIESGAAAASDGSPAPFEKDIAGFYQTLLVPASVSQSHDSDNRHTFL